MTFRVSVESRQMTAAQKRLENLFPPKWVGQQLVRSITRETNQSHRFFVRKAGPVAGIPAKNLRKRIGKWSNKRGRAVGRIFITKRADKIAGREWKAKQVSEGMQLRGLHGAGTVTVPRAFKQKVKAREDIWQRRGKARLPIDRVILERPISETIKRYSRARMKRAPLRIYKHMRGQLIKRARRQRRG